MESTPHQCIMETSRASMTHAIAQRGRLHQWPEALGIFAMMPTKRIQPDVISYNVTLGITSNWQRALEILDHMTGAALQRDVISFAFPRVTLDGLDGWHQTLQSLEEMKWIGLEADVICHNSALHHVGATKSWRLAMAFVMDLVEFRLSDLVTSNTFLNATPWQNAAEYLEGMKVHRNGSSPDVISFNAMMTSYERCSHWQKALDLFTWMPVLPSVVSYGAALSCCATGNCWHIAVRLLQDMKQQRIRSNSHTFSSFILSGSESNDVDVDVWQQTLTVFGNVESSGSSPDVITCNSALGHLTGGGAGSHAWRVTKEVLSWMRGRAVRSDVATQTSIMAACQTWRQAIWCSQEMCFRQIPLNQISTTVLLSSLVVPAAWHQALAIAASAPITLTKSNVLMSCLEHRGRWALTLLSLEALAHHQLRCDAGTLTLSMAAAGRAEEWALASQILQRHLGHHHFHTTAATPAPCHTSSAALAGVPWNSWPKTLQLLTKAQDHGIQPDALMQSAVIESTERAQQWHMAMELFNVGNVKRVSFDVVTQSCALRSIEHSGMAATVPELLETIATSSAWRSL